MHTRQGKPLEEARDRRGAGPLLDPDSVKRYLSFMKSAKGRIVLPTELRRQDDIEPGQEFEIERLVRLAPSKNQGLLDWLLACPDKGFFVAIESESTDTL